MNSLGSRTVIDLFPGIIYAMICILFVYGFARIYVKMSSLKKERILHE